jgi:GntR family transcriptional regulator/MocR family aminotransferase
MMVLAWYCRNDHLLVHLHSHFTTMRSPAEDALIPFIALDSMAGPLYRQIYDGYRSAILEGRLRPGQRVPSTRALARELGISRLPVLTAFEQLLHEGYLEGRAGSGTYVAASILDKANLDKADGSGTATRTTRRPQQGTRPPVRNPRQARSGPDADAPVNAPDRQAGLGAFRVSQPALDHFPSKTWARLVSRHARQMPIELMAYGDPAGHLPLRHAIADYLRTARAVACDASQVLVVSGSQMALQLCARVLLKPGDAFCIEDPGYPEARIALAASGARPRAVPVDDGGLSVRSMAVGRRAARAVYVTPSHQYPLGVCMDAARRLELLEWARRHRSWIIEDDYDSDYRFASRPLGALQGMDTAARVVYTGTFSKVMFPALRIGYVVAPPSLVDRFIAQRQSLDLFPATLYQLALTDFLCEGHFARHVRRMRAIYLARRDALVEEITRRLDGTLTIVNADAGMHLTALLPPEIDDREVVRRAAVRGISAIALSTCCSGKTPKTGLVLGFGGAPEPALRQAVETLAQVIGEVRRVTRRVLS